MDDFKINVARIDMVGCARKETEVCTFHFQRDPIVFQVPLFLKHGDFDDTEMIKAARSILHDIFTHLALQCETWRLTSTELESPKHLNLRPGLQKDAS